MGLFQIIFRNPHLREPLSERLGAFETALLPVATNMQGHLRKNQGAKYLSCIREVFTDYEIHQFRDLAAENEDHRIVLYGPDLVDLFALIQKPQKYVFDGSSL